MSANRIISKLDESFDVEAFACGNKDLDDYLKKYALPNQNRGLGITWVAHVEEAAQVFGYYTLVPTEISKQAFPSIMVQGFPNYPIPCMLLAKLAVQRDAQKKGIGRYLLFDAFSRVLRLREEIALFALLVDAIDDEVIEYYRKLGFVPFSAYPRKLYLSIQTLRDGSTTPLETR